jgi:hypothetical protein
LLPELEAAGEEEEEFPKLLLLCCAVVGCEEEDRFESKEELAALAAAAPRTLKSLELDSAGPELGTLPKRLGEAFTLAAVPRTLRLPFKLAAAAATASTLLRPAKLPSENSPLAPS